ncbi:hypothetical protein AB0N16_26485 [Streptomyces sp. NPDC051105]|uniref:hypothetical protein n=1 Tax=Streptomyces sp. NPDC051105 TaxID=3154843 RepID=UPI00343BBEBB
MPPRRRSFLRLLPAALVLAAGCTTTGTTDTAATDTAATADPGPSAKASATAPSCPGGTFRWTGVTREVRLTAVSPVVKVDDGDRGWITFHTRLVRNIVPRVDTSDGSLSARRVLAALARHLKLWDLGEFAAPGEDSAHHERHAVRMNPLGHGARFVEAKGVTVIEGSFTVACPGRAVYGSVSTWAVDHGASLACGVDPGDEAWVKEAYRLACGGGTA